MFLVAGEAHGAISTIPAPELRQQSFLCVDRSCLSALSQRDLNIPFQLFPLATLLTWWLAYCIEQSFPQYYRRRLRMADARRCEKNVATN